jgi:hypothetical protein
VSCKCFSIVSNCGYFSVFDVDVPLGPTDLSHPSAGTSWSSDLCYQTRPTVIRHPQTSQTWNSVDSQPYHAQCSHNSQRSALPWSRCDVSKEQLSNSYYSSLCNKSLFSSQNSSLYRHHQQQQQQLQLQQQVPYHPYPAITSSNTQSHWFNHVATTQEVERDVISGGAHSVGWNSYALNRCAPLRSENDMKQSNFQFNQNTTYNIPTYSSLASHF